MAYSIGYAPQRCEGSVKRKRIRFSVLVLVFFLVFLFSVQLFSREGAELLRNMILPVGDDTVEAFSSMLQAVEEGTPIPEAVTAFCREVMEHGKMP